MMKQKAIRSKCSLRLDVVGVADPHCLRETILCKPVLFQSLFLSFPMLLFRDPLTGVEVKRSKILSLLLYLLLVSGKSINYQGFNYYL